MGVTGKVMFCILQNAGNDFANSVSMIVIFLTILALVGFCIVKISRRMNLVKIMPKAQLNKGDKIVVLDAKFLYGRRCLYLIKCSKRKILFLVDRENLCKLGEWDLKSHDDDN